MPQLKIDIKKRDLILSSVSIGVLLVLLALAQEGVILDNYGLRVINLCFIYSMLGLSLNLIHGFTGQCSLGSGGFMAIGAYATAILTLSPQAKETMYYMEPILPFLANIQMPYIFALLIGGLLAALAAVIIGFPVFRLKGDYLSIATMGFAEIIRIVFVNAQGLTNGATGLKNISPVVNVWWTFGFLVLTIIFLSRLLKTSYGRAFKAIRSDEFAAEAIGISLMSHKLKSFAISSFIAGIAGGLMASVVGAITPALFKYNIANDILLIVVLGGTCSITGSILGGCIFIISKEALRFLDNGFSIGGITVPGIAGMRMVIFSVLLMVVVLFFRQGIMGTNEFSWDAILNFPRKIRGHLAARSRKNRGIEK